jgi:hypothetical protein
MDNIELNQSNNLPQSEIETTAQKSNTNLLYLLAVIILLLISAIVYLVYQNMNLRNQMNDMNNSTQIITSPTPTATTQPSISTDKTYSNSELGFTFQYSSQFNPTECKNGLDFFVKSTKLPIKEFCETPPLGSISLDYSQIEPLSGFGQSSEYEVTTETITLNSNLIAEKQTINKVGEAHGPDYLVTVTFNNESTYYILSLRDKNYETEFEQILSSFEFTK